MLRENRDLKIKTGVLNRLVKELDSYEKEKITQQERIAKLLLSNADEHDVKKQNEVLQETLLMIPDTVNRIQKAKLDLENLVNNSADSEDLENARIALSRVFTK